MENAIDNWIYLSIEENKWVPRIYCIKKQDGMDLDKDRTSVWCKRINGMEKSGPKQAGVGTIIE